MDWSAKGDVSAEGVIVLTIRYDKEAMFDKDVMGRLSDAMLG
jgi:hypothetical protein